MKHGVNSSVKTRKQEPIILSVIVSVDIGVLADIRYLILKPISTDINNMPIILCIPLRTDTSSDIANQMVVLESHP